MHIKINFYKPQCAFSSLTKLRIISCYQAWSNYFFLTCFVQIRTQTRRHTLHFVSLVPFNLEQALLNFLFLSCQPLTEETSSIKTILFISCSQLFTMHLRTEWTWLIPSTPESVFQFPYIFVFKEENSYM